MRSAVVVVVPCDVGGCCHARDRRRARGEGWGWEGGGVWRVVAVVAGVCGGVVVVVACGGVGCSTVVNVAM